jgi:4-hydroxysphinganine ceramide fatty acyl 2-hydroxylase
MIPTFFRHGSNAVLALAIIASIIAFSTHAVRFSFFAALIGAAVFFVSEYTTHRFLFHAQPSTMPWLLGLQHRLHYDHHIDPPKLELLFLPLWFVIPTTLIYYGVYVAITRNPALALSLTLGSVCALLFYEWVHYVAHVPFSPITPFGRYVKKYHLWHHFKNERFWYGVTNPSMDFVGATYRDVDAVERSTTVREIWRGM